jgi:type I restriction enzyme M protein
MPTRETQLTLPIGDDRPTRSPRPGRSKGAVEDDPGGQYLPVYDKAAALDAIFKDADVKHYGLALFAEHERNALDLWHKGDKFYLHCLSRQKKVLAKPEEIIRQLCFKRLLDMDYRREQMAVEVQVKMGSTVHSKAADIVIYREEILRLTPYIIIELKRPQRRDGLDQLESYMNATGAPFGWWLNGQDQIVRYREDPNIFESIDRLPRADETLDDIRAPRADGVQ